MLQQSLCTAGPKEVLMACCLINFAAGIINQGLAGKVCMEQLIMRAEKAGMPDASQGYDMMVI